ncbi:hypothetical protein Pflav_031600 [Phytohabitans flavus]|uniref:Uncharacterized protein n=1 Tax=Phytohabitans flavus TaxID=1076124 RepID=A0A6F8XSF7_9ACTN|nr:hypothetical protein Pflav_031600 [Phytohabitans flavus]
MPSSSRTGCGSTRWTGPVWSLRRTTECCRSRSAGNTLSGPRPPVRRAPAAAVAVVDRARREQLVQAAGDPLPGQAEATLKLPGCL